MAETAVIKKLKPRVLIVDDSRMVRKTILSLIRSSFDVCEEANGEAGWKTIVNDPSIVAVFSDIQMPELDGFGLLARMRASEDTRIRDIPVIMISGDEDEVTKKRARDAGANDFITKATDGTEILSRIDNLLSLMEAKQQLQANREALQETVTHDPVTGTFTSHYLLTEGRKRYSHARRHGGPLSVVSFSMETYGEITEKVGKDVADQLLARVAKLVLATLRSEDSMGRIAETVFSVISPSTSAEQALAFARRLHGQLDQAKVAYRGQTLKIRAAIGVASLSVDTASSIEDLIKVSMHRMHQAASKAQKRIVGEDEVSLVKAPTLPSDIDRALRLIESINPEQLGEPTNEVVRRLLPFLQASFKRLKMELPIEKMAQALKGKPK